MASASAEEAAMLQELFPSLPLPLLQDVLEQSGGLDQAINSLLELSADSSLPPGHAQVRALSLPRGKLHVVACPPSSLS